MIYSGQTRRPSSFSATWWRADHHHLLVIGAYREDEIDGEHPLAAAFAELKHSQAAVAHLRMRPLDIGDINQLVADALQCQTAHSLPLSTLLARKTDGNPLFLIQLMQDLYRDGLFHFDYERAEWFWDLAQMREMDITDNVVELMIDRIRQVPDETQQVLQNAALHRRSVRCSYSGRDPRAATGPGRQGARAGRAAWPGRLRQSQASRESG